MEIILFICTGNTCRSAMAEVYFNYRIRNLKNFGFYAESGGIMAEDDWKISLEAAQVLSDNNIPVPEAYHSTYLTWDLLKTSRIAFIMTNMHKDHILEHFPQYRDKVFLLSEIDNNDNNMEEIVDPIGHDVAFFQKTFLKMKHYIDKLIEILEKDPEKGLDYLLKNKKEVSLS